MGLHDLLLRDKIIVCCVTITSNCKHINGTKSSSWVYMFKVHGNKMPFRRNVKEMIHISWAHDRLGSPF